MKGSLESARVPLLGASSSYARIVFGHQASMIDSNWALVLLDQEKDLSRSSLDMIRILNLFLRQTRILLLSGDYFDVHQL